MVRVSLLVFFVWVDFCHGCCNRCWNSHRDGLVGEYASYLHTLAINGKHAYIWRIIHDLGGFQMDAEVEVKKVDSQGRLILPSDWRERELKGTSEVYVIRRDGYLKVIPKRKIDLRKFFDAADLGIVSIGEWDEFERLFSEKKRA